MFYTFIVFLLLVDKRLFAFETVLGALHVQFPFNEGDFWMVVSVMHSIELSLRGVEITSRTSTTNVRSGLSRITTSSHLSHNTIGNENILLF